MQLLDTSVKKIQKLYQEQRDCNNNLISASSKQYYTNYNEKLMLEVIINLESENTNNDQKIILSI